MRALAGQMGAGEGSRADGGRWRQELWEKLGLFIIIIIIIIIIITIIIQTSTKKEIVSKMKEGVWRERNNEYNK